MKPALPTQMRSSQGSTRGRRRLGLKRTDGGRRVDIEPATGSGRRFLRHAFVCTNAAACAIDGPAEAIQASLKGLLKASGRKEDVRVNKAGCLGQCGHGPMMVVYPEGIWYSHLTLDDAQRVWDEHLVGGRPVEELRYRTPQGGTNVLGRQPDNRKLALGGPRSEACTRCPSP